MTHVSDFGRLKLRSLAPEPWGRRLARARDGAGLTLRDVEAILSPHIRRATLARLEERETMPTRSQDRARAVLVLLLYGVDPADFGLGPDDVPPATDVRALLRLRSSPIGWMREFAGHINSAA